MSVRPLSLQEWFICHQLRHIDRHHFHLDAQLAADLSGLQQAYGEATLPLTFILVKALALTLRHVPAANLQYFDGLFGPRMVSAEHCSINIPVMLKLEGEDYLSVTTVHDADKLSVAEIQAQVRAYRQTPKAELPIGKFIIGKRNNLFNRSRLRLIHALVNAFPQLMDQRRVGLASVSSLLNLDHAGTTQTINGRGPGAISLTAAHFDQATGLIRLALAYDHYALPGLVMAQAGITLCRILQRELEPDALLPQKL